MSKIKYALDEMQIAFMKKADLESLSKARFNLINTIRESLIESGAKPDQLLKFDKAFFPEKF